MDRAENRLNRTRQLVAEVGSLAKFAEIVGISPAQAWQIAGNAPVRGIGSRMGARIEQAFGKPAGWLDWSMDDALTHETPTPIIGWPFRTVSTADYERLSPDEKLDLEKTVARFVAGCLAGRS